MSRQIGEEFSQLVQIRSNNIKVSCAPIKITNWLIHPVMGANFVHDFMRWDWEECRLTDADARCPNFAAPILFEARRNSRE